MRALLLDWLPVIICALFILVTFPATALLPPPAAFIIMILWFAFLAAFFLAARHRLREGWSASRDRDRRER